MAEHLFGVVIRPHKRNTFGTVRSGWAGCTGPASILPRKYASCFWRARDRTADGRRARGDARSAGRCRRQVVGRYIERAPSFPNQIFNRGFVATPQPQENATSGRKPCEQLGAEELGAGAGGACRQGFHIASSLWESFVTSQRQGNAAPCHTVSMSVRIFLLSGFRGEVHAGGELCQHTILRNWPAVREVPKKHAKLSIFGPGAKLGCFRGLGGTPPSNTHV